MRQLVRPLAAPRLRLQVQAVEFSGIRLVGFDDETLKKLLLTAAIIVVVAGLRRALATTRSLGRDGATRRTVWIRKGVRLVFGALAVLLLLSIWFDRPGRLATFTGLLAAGAAVASQKAILSFAGYFVVVFGKMFDTGDRIQIGDVRGDVLDIGLKATFNYSNMFDFLWEEMRLPLHYDEDLDRAETIALDVAREATRVVVEQARRELLDIRQRYPLQAADLEPQAYVRLTDNWIELTVRFLVRAWGVRPMKDQISRSILLRYRQEGITIASTSIEIARVPAIDAERDLLRRNDGLDPNEAH